MAHAKGVVIVSVAQRAVLERLVRAYTTPQHIAQRARIVLMSAEGKLNVHQARELGTDAQRIRRWRRRWAGAQAALEAAEGNEGEAAYVEDLILELLGDEHRTGRKPTFTAEQVAQIIAVACEKPSEESNRPVTHWTPRELRFEVIKRGIAKDADPEGFARAAAEVCDTYRKAPERHMLGEHIVSTDEKTSIQALERIAPTAPMRPGRVEHQEFEYKRHGTLCLTANFEVATGEITGYTIEPTRTEVEFADHVGRTIAEDPQGSWTFVADHLNTHMSATLVERVATWCGIDTDLGIKASREAFLTDPTHRIRFVYTPKHCSWLNQVEIWFSVLVRRLLKRGDFKSLADLRERIASFIAYFNETLAHPYRWTYTGRALKAS